MILVFTSTAFTEFVKKHVEITSDASFNPYLTFLFFAMYVIPSSVAWVLPSLTSRLQQGRHVCHAFRGISPLSHPPSLRSMIGNPTFPLCGLGPRIPHSTRSPTPPFGRSCPCTIAGSLVHPHCGDIFVYFIYCWPVYVPIPALRIFLVASLRDLLCSFWGDIIIKEYMST